MAREPRRLARGTNAQVAGYTGPSGEPIVNTDTWRLHVQDAATAGGKPLALLTDLDPLDTRLGTAESDIDTLQAQVAALLAAGQPQGRISLTTGVSVMSAAVAGGTTIRYVPHFGRIVPLWDGAKFVAVDFGGELSQALSDNTKSPAAAVANTNYDMFVWLDGATPRCTRGPAWTSATDPGTGAGTTEIEQVNGIWVNKVAITNGPAARRGLYVGSIRTNASAQIDWSLGSGAAGGGVANMTIWNAYNQVEHQINVRDTTASWIYATATTRPMNNSTGNRINLLAGRGAGPVSATLQARVQAAAQFYTMSIGLDSTTVAASGAIQGTTVPTDQTSSAKFRGQVGIGFHYLQALELAGASNQTVFAGGYQQGFDAVWAA